MRLMSYGMLRTKLPKILRQRQFKLLSFCKGLLFFLAGIAWIALSPFCIRRSSWMLILLALISPQTCPDENEMEIASPEEIFEVDEIFSSVMDAQDGKREIDTSMLVLALTNDETDHKEVTKEDVDPHSIIDCTIECGNLKQEVKVNSNIDTVKDIVVNDVHYRNY
ncbi:hypothetical protein SAY87_003261 [Trapa incisa]|uniref:Uncharacterized protein n=1 Tax=Trapa incisa TaxID=236973 RepID=A0AAN7KKA9_9MYRT|nr:hypothetical protein SAY87_003261 [Trapa incisa]